MTDIDKLSDKQLKGSRERGRNNQPEDTAEQ